MKKAILLTALIAVCNTVNAQIDQFFSSLCIVNAVNGLYRENTERVKLQFVASKTLVLTYVDTDNSYKYSIKYLKTVKKGRNTIKYYSIDATEFDVVSIAYNPIDTYKLKGEEYPYMITLSLYRGLKEPAYEAAYFGYELMSK